MTHACSLRKHRQPQQPATSTFEDCVTTSKGIRATRLGQEGVEAINEVQVALEKVLHLANDTLCIDCLRLELLHDL